MKGEEYSYEILMQYFREIVEEDIPVMTSMADVFKTASELPEMGFSRIRLAFVDRFAEQKDLNEFGLLVATNRGMDVKIFDSIAETDKWLSEKG